MVVVELISDVEFLFDFGFFILVVVRVWSCAFCFSVVFVHVSLGLLRINAGHLYTLLIV
jgi:hypothetical protein